MATPGDVARSGRRIDRCRAFSRRAELAPAPRVATPPPPAPAGREGCRQLRRRRPGHRCAPSRTASGSRPTSPGTSRLSTRADRGAPGRRQRACFVAPHAHHEAIDGMAAAGAALVDDRPLGARAGDDPVARGLRADAARHLSRRDHPPTARRDGSPGGRARRPRAAVAAAAGALPAVTTTAASGTAAPAGRGSGHCRSSSGVASTWRTPRTARRASTCWPHPACWPGWTRSGGRRRPRGQAADGALRLESGGVRRGPERAVVRPLRDRRARRPCWRPRGRGGLAGRAHRAVARAAAQLEAEG